jgi:phosphoribosylformylglycinamidine synthase
MWQFAQACAGIKEACAKLNTPVVSGNVSLYNETNGVSVYPTPSIGMVGVLKDASKLLSCEFKDVGNSVYLVGDTASEFGGSLYLKVMCEKIGGTMPKVNLEKELTLWNLIISANEKGLLRGAKDLSLGGLAVALAKCVALGERGFKGESGFEQSVMMFAESLSRVIVEVKPEHNSSFEVLAGQMGMNVSKIGVVTEKDLILDDVNVTSETLKELYFKSFKEIIHSDMI